jgi:Ca2+-transporting ATPase
MGSTTPPAQRQADIGVAMGVTGTDVSKEAADMILADDNFATIIAAVQRAGGSTTHPPVRALPAHHQLRRDLGHVPGLGARPAGPLLPVQILWINLVTDGLPAIALGLEPVERDAMRRPPRAPTESIFARGGCGSTRCGSGRPWPRSVWPC